MAESDPDDRYDPADDAPGVDEPENRLHFDELHTLVQEAARDAWETGDYHEAVVAAWTALADRLRERLGSTADGMELIEEIYGEGRGRDDPPRLALTDFDSPTSKGMHHGLVHLLRGIVMYVRNPEQHGRSEVRGDKVGAFERLALLSLCAWHIDIRTEPVSVDDAIDELRQERFANTADTRAELISAVPAADHVRFATVLVQTAGAASDDLDEELAARCRSVHRQLGLFVVAADRQHVFQPIAREIDRLVSRDDTLDFAIRFVTPPIFDRLAQRNQRKVSARILEDVAEGARTRGPQSGVFHRDGARIFPSLSVADREKFLGLVESALADGDPQRRTYGTWMAFMMSRHLQDGERARLVTAIVDAIAAGNADVVAETERRLRAGGVSYKFRTALRIEAEEARARTAEGAAQLDDVRALMPSPVLRVRRVRSTDDRQP